MMHLFWKLHVPRHIGGTNYFQSCNSNIRLKFCWLDNPSARFLWRRLHLSGILDRRCQFERLSTYCWRYVDNVVEETVTISNSLVTTWSIFKQMCRRYSLNMQLFLVTEMHRIGPQFVCSSTTGGSLNGVKAVSKSLTSLDQSTTNQG